MRPASRPPLSPATPVTADPGRRRFLGLAGAAGVGVVGAGLLSSCTTPGSEGGGEASASGAGDVALGGGGDLPEVTMDLATSWPAGLASLFGSEESGVGAVGFASVLSQLTGGRFVLSPRPAGDLAGATEVVDAIQSGAVPAGHTASYYYIGKSPAFAFGTTLPFGLTYRQQYAWLHHHRDDSGRTGLDVLRQFYADRYGLIQFPCGNTGVQMGGFFNREIASLGDLQGLVMRIPGLGGEIMSRLGVTVQVLAAGEIAQALQTGAIDAAEFVGPYDDDALGLGEAGRFYYYPGWWEPGATFEVVMDLERYEELPAEYQEALEVAGELQYLRLMGFYDAVQAESLARIEAQGAETRPFPADVIDAAREESEALLDEFAAQDEDFATILEHWRPFRDSVQQWHGLAERSMAEALAGGAPAT
jgi:TRAP-type mannitol/chloroaromatic compound transport system substrate-binding protein